MNENEKKKEKKQANAHKHNEIFFQFPKLSVVCRKQYTQHCEKLKGRFLLPGI